MRINQDELLRFHQNNSKYFDPADLPQINQWLAAYLSAASILPEISYKSPTTGTVLSVIGGGLGIDRFYAGNYLAGLIKLATGGGLGIWWIADWFLIGKAIKKDNLNRLYQVLTGQGDISAKQRLGGIVTTLQSPGVKQAFNDLKNSAKKFSDTWDC